MGIVVLCFVVGAVVAFILTVAGAPLWAVLATCLLLGVGISVSAS